ncbi:hypothetical protein EK21DRAFT_110883 [Setomelanomma holmii]|uniref:Uncharacterized protein n=1 Tax=Setomelanomma holmii TaxID=210430 RepID=A0A9P4HCF0_9PLEO|nr:hypothetical protein EK21DRAFT_110883 [Setomelanomma holmii]
MAAVIFVTITVYIELTIRINRNDMTRAGLSSTGRLLAFLVGIGTSVPVFWCGLTTLVGQWTVWKVWEARKIQHTGRESGNRRTRKSSTQNTAEISKEPLRILHGSRGESPVEDLEFPEMDCHHTECFT